MNSGSEASGSGEEIREAEEEVHKAQERLRKAREQAAADQDPGGHRPTRNELGAKGFGWYVAGSALLLIGAALWIGLATHKKCSGILTPRGLCLFGHWSGHPAKGAIVFLVLGGIGAVCMFAGYASRQQRSPN